MGAIPLGPQNARYAWRDLARKGLPKRSAVQRVADFLEIYGPYDEATAREQASRCIQCAEPMCVTGCPLGNQIPAWMLLTAEGRFLEAATVLQESNNLSDICTRLCPTDHLCEGMCVLNGKAEPVSIGAIEQFLNEYAFAHGLINVTAVHPNGRRVAVAGSGPCGLTCADELSRRGFSVTIFDTDLLPGGLFFQGLPAFRLEKSILERRINALRQRGVEFRLGVTVGLDVPLAKLREEFDAVFLGLELCEARPLRIPGADLPGVVQALPFILQTQSGVRLDIPHIDVTNKRVVVIGGGDTAMDCIRTAIRSGATDVLGVYRRDEASLPCGRREYENALEEGARFEFLAAPVAVLQEDGRTHALRLIRTRLSPQDATGRPSFSEIPGSEFEVAADWVILALGFVPGPLPPGNDLSQLARTQGGGIAVDNEGMTTMPGVFAGGDLVHGPALVLDLVRDARRAANSITSYLEAVPSSS
jgi:glutamate synthase (NADPH/NADH) small chain